MKIATKRILCIILLLVSLLTLFSCEEKIKPKSQTLSFLYFDTVSTLYDYSGLSEQEFAAVCNNAKKSLQKYHEFYDIYNEYDGITNLAAINASAGKGAIRVEKEIIDLLLYSKEMHELTSGKVNIAFGAVLKIWHEYRTEGIAVPSEEELRKAALHTDINNLIIDEENMTVELIDPQMRLDVGAIAKGYAVEMVAREIEEMGHESIVLDVGGNLRTIGTKTDGSGWKTAVRNPEKPNSSYVYYHELKNEAISTSGGYERFYTVDGIRYHHIINDKTLMPENYYLSVSIIAPSSALTDSLSTAVFNMTYEEVEAFIKNLTGVRIVLVLQGGEVKEFFNE